MPHCTVMAHAYGQQCLPHTGLDTLPFAIGGIALVLLGVALLRFFREPEPPKRPGWPPVKPPH